MRQDLRAPVQNRFSHLFFKIFKSPARLFLLINLAIIFIVFILGFKSSIFEKKISSADLASYNGKNINFNGFVCEEADVDYKSRRLTFCANGKVLITTNLYPEYNYGDYLKVNGLLKAPEPFNGFNYDSYLARYDIYSLMYYPKISLSSGTLNFSQNIFLTLLKGKWYLKSIIDQNLNEPEAGLANALLLGYRRTVLSDDLKIFSRVGLSHMIAISGSHITILSAMLINFLLALGIKRKYSFYLVITFLIIYPLITGLSASAVRSAIMGGLAFMAIYYKRSTKLINALVFSGALMLLINPQILRADIGFQLSFLALLGIIYLYPIGENLTKSILEKLKLKKHRTKILKNMLDIINLTLVSQIITLPILLINFKQLSLISPLANLLILWTFAPLLGLLIIAIFTSAIFPFIGPWLFLPAYLLLKYIFIMSKLLAQPNWAAITINNFNWFYGTVYYLILALIVYCYNKKINRAPAVAKRQ
ncbi:MAG: ComEC/Rec2 family competence protein [Patescibacteria group bacterium]